MSTEAPAWQDPAEETPDPSIARAERRLRLLEELSEIGMELARALKPGAQADKTAADKAHGKDPAAAFAPLSRAIRLTLALEAKTCEALRDLKAGVVRAREEEHVKAVARATAADDEATYASWTKVWDAVTTVARAEIEDGEAYEDLLEALDERLEEDEAYEDYDERPLRETVERLCKDLGLDPDWSRWDGEGWEAGYAPIRPRCSPFNQPSPHTVLREPDRPSAETPAPYQSFHALE